MLNENFWVLNDRQLCDCQMILDGSFYPLNRFMTEHDYNHVIEKMRLESGELFPLPIVLDVNEKFSQNLLLNEKIILRNKEGFVIAKMIVESIWKPNLEKEAELVYKDAVKVIDKAVSKNLIHKNTGARRKSQITRFLNSLS